MEEVSNPAPYEPSRMDEGVSQSSMPASGYGERTVQEFDEADFRSELKGYESSWTLGRRQRSVQLAVGMNMSFWCRTVISGVGCLLVVATRHVPSSLALCLTNMLHCVFQ